MYTHTHTNGSVCFMSLPPIFQILLHHQKRQIKPQKCDESAICHTERSWIIYIKRAPPSQSRTVEMPHQFTCNLSWGAEGEKKKYPNVLLVCQKCSSPHPNQRSLIFPRLFGVFYTIILGPARPSGGGTAAPAVPARPPQKHTNSPK